MPEMRVRGRPLMIAILAFTAVFAVVLWYAQYHAFYDESVQESVEIAGESYPVTDWQGIDAGTSPLKLRACFRLEGDAAAGLAARLEPADKPTPLVAPGWFECFDAQAIDRALARGEATAYLAATEEFDGVDRVVAVFPDGRAYMWRQLNERFAD